MSETRWQVVLHMSDAVNVAPQQLVRLGIIVGHDAGWIDNNCRGTAMLLMGPDGPNPPPGVVQWCIDNGIDL